MNDSMIQNQLQNYSIHPIEREKQATQQLMDCSNIQTLNIMSQNSTDENQMTMFRSRDTSSLDPLEI